MNTRLEYKEVVRLYKAKFDNYPEPLPNSFGAGSPLKHASNLGATQELKQAMMDAVESGQPMDFSAFAKMLNERSVADAKALQSRSDKESPT